MARDERLFDFDQFMAEQEKNPVVVKIFGEREELPDSLPASLVLKVMRLRREGKDEVPEEDTWELAVGIFGEERLQRWADKGLTVKGLEALITNVVAIYMGRAPEVGKKQDDESEEQPEVG